VPNPYASDDEVHIFLTQFLIAMDSRMTQEDAQNEANKLRVDGKGLYELAREDFKECFGLGGVSLHRELYTSAYGYVRISLLLDSL